MDQISRPARAALFSCWLALLTGSTAFGQAQLGSPQALPQQAAPPAATQQPVVQQQPAAPQVPNGFQLNALQQAALNQALDTWQAESGKVQTFKCAFQRWEYNMAFGPRDKNIPLNKNRGELSYRKPDKGSFQITEINTFREDPVPPGQQAPAVPKGNWVKQPEDIGEHWVCDGQSIYEYRTGQKQLVERPIPAELRGQGIVDGPLPFLFGAEAAKLKQRYWMRVEQQPNTNQIWLVARPRFQAQAADFSQVEVILNSRQMLPEAMQVTLPNGDRHMYVFEIANATVNGTFDGLKALFDAPRVPFGWKRVVENVPVAQVPPPVQDAPQTR